MKSQLKQGDGMAEKPDMGIESYEKMFKSLRGEGRTILLASHNATDINGKQKRFHNRGAKSL